MNKYFKRAEFKCKCGNCYCDTVDAELLGVLTKTREQFGVIHILSGHRCRIHNDSVGGTARSQHILGKAADIAARDVAPADIYSWLDLRYSGKYGIGSYDSFTHIDVRSNRARW